MTLPVPPFDLAFTVARAQSQTPAGSPCTNVCRMDLGVGVCGGCFRSRMEIKHYKSMDDAERRSVLGDLLARRDRFSHTP
jgi:uncharacterized protein